MKYLPIKRILNEETRAGSVWTPTKNGIKVFSMHITDNEVIITDHSDFTRIYSIMSLDYYKEIQ